jgi:aryl-alcohol dehydrogenase-like predicted oxidoreductase
VRYRLLGSSGLRVSELALGTMTFGEDWGFGASQEESARMFEAFAEAGGNLIDTADRYTGGTSERIVGQLVASDRDRFVLASKYGLTRRPGDPNASGGHRKSVVAALEASLGRLGLDYIDLYIVHTWDELTGIEEVLRALDDQVRSGKILYAGISNWPAWLVARAATLAEERELCPLVAIQIEYSLIQRDAERELLPMAKALDLGVMAWAPLGGGVLTGKYAGAEQAGDRRLGGDDPRLSDRNLGIAQAAGEIARELGTTAAAVAIAWLIRRDAVTIPVVGARSASQLAQSLQATEVELSPDQLESLERVSAVELGYPHDFLASEAVKDRAYGGLFDAIADRRKGRSV